MKKFIKFLLIPITLLTLNSCKKEEHQHTLSTEYFVTETTHGHKCQECGEILDEEPHAFAKVPNKKFKVENEENLYYKSCSKCGKVSLETFNISDLKSYQILEEPEVKNLDQIIDEFLPGADEQKTLIDLAKSFENQYIGKGEVTYKRYKISYESTDYKNEPIILSGAVTIPCHEGKPKINALIVDSHPTVPISQAPSKGFDITSIPAILGLAEFEPDLIGMGLTEDKIMDYHCRHVTSRSTADGVTAFYNILNEILDIDTYGLTLFNTGYSQGGYDAMAFLRYMEQDATEDEKALINICKTYCGSGAYSLQILFEETLKKEKFASIEYILMALITMFNYHPEFFAEITMNDILTDYGMEFIEPIMTNNDSLLSSVKNRRDGTKIMGHYPSYIFKLENIENNEKVKNAMNRCFDEENLLKDWMPKGKLSILYTTSDELVSPKCSLAAIETFKHLPNFTSSRSLEKDHTSAAIGFYYESLLNIKNNYLKKVGQ